MFQDITIEEWQEQRANKTFALIDVRSPSEYNEATIPGSINIPFFNDEERAEIGTLYKQVSIQAAKERGLAIISAKLPSFISKFSEIKGNKVVFCWRGGMRSRTTATLLSLMDIHALRITGGYRAYRQWTVDQLSELTFKPEAIVLQGLTGCGKTAILKGLADRGHAVLDLEALAGHRGSIFGGIGLKPRNQKSFDGMLIEQMIAYQDRKYVLFEAENRRIGKIALPDLLLNKRDSGKQIFIELPIQARAKHIVEDYKPWENAEECRRAFLRIKDRIHTPIASEIDALLSGEHYEKAVEMLLVHYYDPRYTHSFDEHSSNIWAHVKADTIEDAQSQVELLLAEAFD